MVAGHGSSHVGNQSRLWIRAPSSPTRGRFYLFLSVDFVSALLVPSSADTTNSGCTNEAGALAKEFSYMFGEKYLAKYCFKRES